MDTFLLLVRLALAAVFAVAGIAKFFDLPGSISAVQGFGVPERFSRLVGIGLPIAELTIAIGLIPLATAPAAAIAGTVLMGVFVAAIAVNLARGKRPDCHCFGKLHSAPIGWQTLVRNGAIAFGALLVAIGGAGMSLTAWLRDLDGTGQVLLGLLLVALAILGWQWRTVGQLTGQATALASRIDTIQDILDGKGGDEPGLVPGTAAPGFLLKAIGKGMVTLNRLTDAGKPVLLVFAEPTCSVCNTLMPKLARFSRDLDDTLTVAVVSTGSEEANRKKVDRHGLEWVLLQESREVTMSYRVPGTPSAVLLDRNGIVAERIAFGPDPILSLLGDITEAIAAPVSGTPSPNHTRANGLTAPAMAVSAAD